MPRSEHAIVVLVASPSDLEPERNRLEELISELNTTWSRSLRLRLDLVRWETHAYPGMGEDPQDVLNRELADEPDIFIGLMWSRFGTETGRAGSGTEEEFNQALARYRENPESVRIMFYFKNAPISPSNIDPDQFREVMEFRNSLGSEGALFWRFNTLEEFERILRVHLSRQIQEFSKRDLSGSGAGLPARVAEPPHRFDAQSGTEEFGLLDYLDFVDDRFNELKEIMGRMSEEVNTIGIRLGSHTEAINGVVARSPGGVGRRQARALIRAAADDMMCFAERTKEEIPQFRASLQAGSDAAANAVLIAASLDSQDKSHVLEAREGLAEFQSVLGSTYENIEMFMCSVQEWPRMTVHLNRAKRETVSVLQTLLDSIDEGRRIIIETIKTLDAILKE